MRGGAFLRRQNGLAVPWVVYQSKTCQVTTLPEETEVATVGGYVEHPNGPFATKPPQPVFPGGRRGERAPGGRGERARLELIQGVVSELRRSEEEASRGRARGRARRTRLKTVRRPSEGTYSSRRTCHSHKVEGGLEKFFFRSLVWFLKGCRSIFRRQHVCRTSVLKAAKRIQIWQKCCAVGRSIIGPSPAFCSTIKLLKVHLLRNGSDR